MPCQPQLAGGTAGAGRGCPPARSAVNWHLKIIEASRAELFFLLPSWKKPRAAWSKPVDAGPWGQARDSERRWCLCGSLEVKKPIKSPTARGARGRVTRGDILA